MSLGLHTEARACAHGRASAPHVARSTHQICCVMTISYRPDGELALMAPV